MSSSLPPSTNQTESQTNPTHKESASAPEPEVEAAQKAKNRSARTSRKLRYGYSPYALSAEIPVCPPMPKLGCPPPVNEDLLSFLQFVTNSTQNAYFYTSACYLNAGTTVVYDRRTIEKQSGNDKQNVYNDYQGDGKEEFPLYDTLTKCNDIVWTSRINVQNFFEFFRIATDDANRLPPFVLNGMLTQFWGWPESSGDQPHCFIPSVVFNPTNQYLDPYFNPGNPALVYGNSALRTSSGLQFLLRSAPFQMVVGATGSVTVSIYQWGPNPQWIDWATGSIECPVGEEVEACHTPGTRFSIQLNITEQFCGSFDVSNRYNAVLGGGSQGLRTFIGYPYPNIRCLFNQSVFLNGAQIYQQIVPVPDANTTSVADPTCGGTSRAVAQRLTPQQIKLQIAQYVSQAPGSLSTENTSSAVA